MNMARWAEDTTLKFVNEYVKHDCLWDVRNENYKNKQKRLEAYSAMGDVMGIEGFGHREVTQKIKNIRSTYSQEKKKISDSKKGGTVYTPTVRWFNSLDSVMKLISGMTRRTDTSLVENDTENLVKYRLVGGTLKLKVNLCPHKFDCQKAVKPKKQLGAYEKRRRTEFFENIITKEVPSTSSPATSFQSFEMIECDKMEFNETEDITFTESDDTCDDLNQFEDVHENAYTEECFSKPVEIPTPAPTPRIPRHSGQKRKMQEIQNTVPDVRMRTEEIHKPAQESEFEVFGKNVSMQLQNMPLELALEAQEKIQTILSRLRRQHLQDQKMTAATTFVSSSAACTNVSNPSGDYYLASSSDNVHYGEYNVTKSEQEDFQEYDL